MTEKIRIALFIRGFHDGGIEKVFETYFTHMDLSPFEIHVITHMPNIPEKKKKFENMGCVIHELSKVHGHKLNRKNFSEYRKLFSLVRFDIVHNNMPENLLPLLYARKYKIPVRILHAHNNYTEGYDKKNPLVRKLFLMGFALNTKNATQLVAVSNVAAESAFAERSRETLILKNAVDLDKFAFNQDARREIRKKLSIADQEVLFGHIGRYENNQKNQEFVLNLFKVIADTHNHCKLVMIGDGARRGEFMEMANSLGISDKVNFTGTISNVNAYLSAMDIYLFPSRKEGLGIAGVEAQASGLRCIFSDKIPEEANITEEVVVLGIEGEQAVLEWAAEIKKMLPLVLLRGTAERRAAVEQVREAGFGIYTQVTALNKLYRGII